MGVLFFHPFCEKGGFLYKMKDSCKKKVKKYLKKSTPYYNTLNLCLIVII